MLLLNKPYLTMKVLCDHSVCLCIDLNYKAFMTINLKSLY